MLILYVQIREPVSGNTRQQEFQLDPATLDDATWLKLKAQVLSWAAEMPTVGGPIKLGDLSAAAPNAG